jgi:ATP-binding cassette subfamily B protein
MQPLMRASSGKLSDLVRVYRLIWSASRKPTLVWGLLLIVQGLLPVILVYLTKPLVDAVQETLGRGVSWPSVQPILVVVFAMGFVLILRELIRVALDWAGEAQAELVRDHLSDLVHAKSTSVDFAFYETPDYYDRMYRARHDATNRPLSILESTGSLVQNGISVLGMAAVLFRYGAWLPPILLISTLPAFYVVIRASRRYHAWSTSTTEARRKTQYFDVVLTDEYFAGEVRFFGLAGYFRAAFREARRHLRIARLALIRDQSLARFSAEVAALLVSAAAIAWVVARALLGRATLGDIALFYQALQTGQGLVRALLADIGQIYGNGLFLRNLFEFLDLRARVADPPSPCPLPRPLQQGVRFRNVTFRYPNTDRIALDNFNLVIPAGSIVAIVGANGAGKSTLMKLMCRFFDPESGSVEIDGIDLRSVALDELRGLMTIMLQEPVDYHETARQNIALGNLRVGGTATEVETAARLAGAHDVISSLPKGYETLLGKWWADGTELSAGEWQRVALARAYLRKSELLVLDEPTSMMDPWGEAEWFEKFRTFARRRTAVLITHRLAIAMRADVIHVMERGRIVESGNHCELLARRGLYARSWFAQTDPSSRPGGEPVAALAVAAGNGQRAW